MKKVLLASLAIATITSFASARTADRHGMEAPAPVAPATVQAPAPATAQASAPATAQCPVAAQCPLKSAACDKSAADYMTNFGVSYISAGASFDILKTTDKYIGGGANIEASINVFKSCDDTYGLNIAVPLSYMYRSIGSEIDNHAFAFPVFARPYYRFVVSEDVMVTVFANCGVGGMYSYTHGRGYQDFAEKDLDLTWAMGGGVEIAFFKDFAFTPKYLYQNIETKPSMYYQSVGAEFDWKFTKNMAAVIEYQYNFYRGDSTENVMFAKIRYNF